MVQKTRFLVKIPEIHKQYNSVNCGLYAITNTVEFCISGFTGGFHVQYEEKYMRDHLISCFEKGEFKMFPGPCSQFLVESKLLIGFCYFVCMILVTLSYLLCMSVFHVWFLSLDCILLLPL